jgi:hypothetical protein
MIKYNDNVTIVAAVCASIFAICGIIGKKLKYLKNRMKQRVQKTQRLKNGQITIII